MALDKLGERNIKTNCIAANANIHFAPIVIENFRLFTELTKYINITGRIAICENLILYPKISMFRKISKEEVKIDKKTHALINVSEFL